MEFLGAMLKWKWRHQVLAGEIKYYNPDILLMQEVDEAKVESFWRPLLNEIGLDCTFSTFPKKAHGSLVAFRSALFIQVSEMKVLYDEASSDEEHLLRLSTTKNTGMAVALQFKPEAGQQTSKGLVIGNSHLYWHPNGSYERGRQLGSLAIELEKFAQNFENWPVLLGGDFNSSPEDIPYTMLVKRPSRVSDVPPRTMEIFKRSIDYLHTKQDDPEGAGSTSHDDRINALVKLYQKIERHGTISFYGEHYKSVHPQNSVQEDYNEPAFSNWAHSWRGLLDYIFYFTPNNQPSQVKALQLLRMPEPSEMGDDPSGQPREKQYPSDHLCIMAVISVC